RGTAPSVAAYVRATLGTISARARAEDRALSSPRLIGFGEDRGSVENIGARLLWENQGQGRGGCENVARPRSMPTKRRIASESYSAPYAAGSDRLNHCCKK